MTLLIVDDQRNVLEGLTAGIDYQQIGIDVVLTAASAVEALQKLRGNHVDILMSDIEMPGRSGLELFEEVTVQYPDVLLILLTSHAVFSYAQEGVRLGCFDYLVQPAPYEVIADSLKRAVAKRNETTQRKELSRIGKLFESNRPEFLDSAALRLCSADKAEAEQTMVILNELGHNIGLNTEAQVIISEYFPYVRKQAGSPSRKELRRKLLSALEDCFAGNGMTWFLSDISEERTGLIVLLYPQEARASELQPAQALYKRIREAWGDSFAFYAAPVQTVDTLSGALNTARELRRENVTKTGGFFTSGVGTKTVFKTDNLSGCLTRWNTMLRSNNRTLLLQEIDQYLDHQLENIPNKFQHLCELHQQLTQILFRYYYDNSIDIDSLFSEEYTYSDYLESYRTVESFKKSIRYLLGTEGRYTVQDVAADYVERTRLYIIENANQNLLVKDVAEHLNLNPEHLTRVFKKATGINIKDYILQCKIAAAKDLLANSSLTVSMVALELGISNFSHFAQMFKKLEGMTPSEYRAKLSGKGVEE